jgi:hypothetical protein
MMLMTRRRGGFGIMLFLTRRILSKIPIHRQPKAYLKYLVSIGLPSVEHLYKIT